MRFRIQLSLRSSCPTPPDIHPHCAGRFNERLVLSLASNPACILMDDELNILPTSSHVANIKPLPRDDDGADLAGRRMWSAWSVAARPGLWLRHGCVRQHHENVSSMCTRYGLGANCGKGASQTN